MVARGESFTTLALMSWAEKILKFHFSLKTDILLPEGVEWLFPFNNGKTKAVMEAFFTKYFDDNRPRILLFGINPGRFGAGITGTPFTDPIRLEQRCCIPNSFVKRQELSSVFIYEIIDGYGSIEEFYEDFYITSLCPLGFIKNGKNYNYYDSNALYQAVKPLILDNIRKQLDFGGSSKVALCLGHGKNYAFFKKINAEYQFFDEILPLPHPRWVMQYRLKKKTEFIRKYVEALNSAKRKEG